MSWDTIKSIVGPPLAAAVAVTPLYQFFANKSALQLEEELPKLTMKDKAKGGVKLAPSVGIVVGSQMRIQNLVEKALNKEQKEKTLKNTLKSAAIVGTITSPLVAILNGKIRGLPLATILKGLKSPAMTGAIALQETAFVGGISAADKVIEELKKRLGDNLLVNGLGSFLAGASGSLAGHPANTAVTRWQEGKKVKPQILCAGAAQKAIGTGLFAVTYNVVKNILNKE